MEDVLEVYQRPYDPARPVVCLDEKSKELHTTPHGILPAEPKTQREPGKPRREDYEYQRNGTRNLFLWVEPLSGKRQVCVTERRTARGLCLATKVTGRGLPRGRADRFGDGQSEHAYSGLPL